MRRPLTEGELIELENWAQAEIVDDGAGALAVHAVIDNTEEKRRIDILIEWARSQQ